MLTQTIHKQNDDLLSNFIFSNTTDAGNKGDLFTKVIFESRDIKLFKIIIKGKKRRKNPTVFKKEQIYHLCEGKKALPLTCFYFLLFFLFCLTQNSSPSFARTYLSQGQGESLSHHHNKLPRVCLLCQCTSHQECSPLFPVCIYSYGCLQSRKNTELSETVVKIFISYSPAELFVLLFSKAVLRP